MERGEVIIDRMLVVVFDTEGKADAGRRALIHLQIVSGIGVYASAVIAKNADGTATVKSRDDVGQVGPMMGVFLGSIIGLLGGPAGVAMGAGVGLLAGGAAELNNARINADFIDDVTAELLPNRFALVAEIREGSTAPLDDCMKAIGGTVFRRALSDVTDIVDDEELSGMKADLARLKAELAQAHADRKAKLHEKISQLNSKVQARLEKAKQRRHAVERRTKSRVEDLKAKATAATGIGEDE